MKNRSCVADTFLERFWVAVGQKMGSASVTETAILGAIFIKKSEKWHPKRHPKIDGEKASKNYEKNIQNDAKMDAKINDF